MDSAPPPAAPLPAEPITGIVIPVREAETLVRSRMLQVPPHLRPIGSSIGAHVTLLAPFHPESDLDDAVLDHLARFFADLPPFAFALSDVCEFPGGITYLAPEPAASFRRLILELHRAFPEFPPYGGAFDDIVPHLTVPLAPDETTAELRQSLGSQLPIQTYASQALLVRADQDDTRVIATFPFGTTAA